MVQVEEEECATASLKKNHRFALIDYPKGRATTNSPKAVALISRCLTRLTCTCKSLTVGAMPSIGR